MPKKDPMTGCMVMTMPEFLQAMAKHDKCTVEEVIDSTFGEMARQEERDRQEYKENVFENVCREIDQWNKEAEDQIEKPVKMIELLEFDYDTSMRSFSLKVVMRAEREDGSIGILTMTVCLDYGSYWEPPAGGLIS